MNWDEYFFSLIPVIAAKSKDPSTKVGAVIVAPDRSIISTGYNGFPIGVKETPERLNDRPTKYKFVAHAEFNAILLASRNGKSVKGATLYLEWYPCTECAKAIIQSGISNIVVNENSEQFNNKELQERWKVDTDISTTMLMEAGVNLRHWSSEK